MPADVSLEFREQRKNLKNDFGVLWNLLLNPRDRCLLFPVESAAEILWKLIL